MSARRDHDRLEELFAARALGGLDAEDEREFARLRVDHGACALCESLESEFGEVAGRLAFALEAVRPREGFEDEVVEAARTSAVLVLDERRPRRRRGMLPGPRDLVYGWIAAAAVVIALVFGGLGGYVLGAGGEGAPAELIALLSRPGTQVAPLTGTGDGNLALAYDPARGAAFLVGAGLPSPPEGQTYQLWMIRDETPVSAGTFSPDDGLLLFPVPEETARSDAVAVTLELDGGADQPTSDPIFLAPIGA
jgi:anti-sigma-K factor RskA